MQLGKLGEGEGGWVGMRTFMSNLLSVSESARSSFLNQRFLASRICGLQFPESPVSQFPESAGFPNPGFPESVRFCFRICVFQFPNPHVFSFQIRL